MMINKDELRRKNSQLREFSKILEDSQQRYLALYNQAPVGYLTLQSDTTIIELNPAAERMLQPGGNSSSAGESFCKYVSLECQAPLTLAFRSLFNDGVPIQMELELARGESRKPCHVVLEATVTESQGTLLGRVVLLDVTERRVLQEQMARARRVEGIALLAGGVAHKFNNLMTVVGGCCELLLEQLPEADSQRELVRDIQEAGFRASYLTSQLLDIGRRENSSYQLMELNSAIQDIAGFLQQLLPEGVNLQVDTAAQSLLVTAEKVEIERILQNLVANAGDSQPAGGRVRVQVSRCSREVDPLSPSSPLGSFAGIAVSDQGHGISKQRQARIFEPFYSSKPRDEGAGLGLAVVDGIVRRRGGTVEVESEIDKGTTVTVFLPLAQQVSSVGGRQTRPTGDKARSVRTVLMAEDEPSVRKLVGRILRADGHEVIVSASGEEALAQFISHPQSFDLLLTDVVMPGMGGLELALRVRALSPGLPILFMSGYTDDTVRDRMGPIGSCFIGKPFSRSELSAMVWKMCIEH